MREGAPGEGAWYDRIRYELVKRLLGERLGGASVLVDVGCGQGGILRHIRADHPQLQLIGVDPFLTDAVIASLASEGIRSAQGLPDGQARSADVVLLMDVLEHVEDPLTLLEDALSLLAEGGVALVTVPSYRWLWSDHDVALGHRDRYTRRRLLDLISRLPGDDVRLVHHGYALPLLLLGAAPPRLLQRLTRAVRKTEPTSQVQSVGSSLESVLQRVGCAEARAVGASSPFGLTCAALLRREAGR